uniref:(California timema) hypothetical protein n=1 Tax=Timema californicum TaxID=61474 RepID=A0A7R9JIQ8_TIMCA|nr:unnamed protein product [Timema californicum]
MKSLWDGFLPIKEQIKDESDTSNSVDEIVKTEIKLFDSSFGILDSNIDHFTPLDKYESKLEQDQSTMSSVLLQSNTLAQTSCAFNLNIGCVNENQDLSFNALHKKAEHRKLLPKILCHEVKENVTLEYKKSFLNSYRTNYVKEHQNLFNEGVYKIQACSDSHLTFGEFKDNIEIIMISSTHPKLEGFFVSTEATDTKCNLENYTKKGGNCIAHGDKGICKTKNCINKIQSGGYCIAHVVGRKCHTNNCTKYALQGGNCFSH